MSSTVTFDEFLAVAAAGGPVVAVRADAGAPVPGEPRRVDGAAMTRLSGVYAEFARAWEFPDYFGANKDAFDDCMRDLSGTSLVTEIDSAQRLLIDDPGQLRWFADALTFYGEHYRDASEPTTFAVVLSAPAISVSSVRRRWRGVDADPIVLGD